MGAGGAVSYSMLVTGVVCALYWGTAYAAWYSPNYRGSDSGSTGYQRASDYDEYPPRRSNDYDQDHNSYDSYNTKPRRSRPSHGNSYNNGNSHHRPNGNSYNSAPSYRSRHDNYGSSNHGNNNYGSSSHGNNNYGSSNHGSNNYGGNNHGNRNSPRYDSYSSRSNRHTSPRRPNPYTDGYTRSRRRNSHSQVSSSRHQSSSHHTPSRRPSRSSISHWYHPSSSYGNSYRRKERGRNRRGYYQASYDLGKNNYYSYKYPSIPKYDYSYSHDTSNYYSYKNSKIACYQCNYGPGKTTWKLVTVRKSVPDPYYPFRYMSVNSRQYVRKEGVSAGWDKCQGALSRRSAAKHGVYQDATCEGSCYVRVDKNQMVYRGCYAGEWGVNPHMHGCSYQAGSLYCFCRGDRCNGFMAPNGYSDPYPVGYGERQEHPYPSDYPRSSRYDPYPGLRSYHRSHPVSSSRRHHRRYRRATGGDGEEEDQETLAENSVEVYNRLMGSNVTGTSNVSGHTDETSIRRACYSCKAGGGCRNQFTDTQAAAALGVKTDTDCYGNCYVRLNSNKGVSRGCFAGEMGLNQHLIGCHVQEDATYCFCRGNLCNNFAVTMVTPQNEAKVDKVIAVAKNVSKEKVTDLRAKSPKPQDKEDYPMVLYYIEFPSDH